MTSGKDRSGREPKHGKPRGAALETRRPKPTTAPKKTAASPKATGPTAAGMLAAILQTSESAIIGETLDGIVVSWSPGAERLFGYSIAEMMGKPVSIIAPPARPHEMAEILNRVRDGEQIRRYETERRRKDGTLVPISLSVAPILDERGHMVGVSKIARDITVRRATEHKLRAKTAQLDELSHALDLAPAIYPQPLLLAAGFGLLTALGFSLPALMRARDLPPSRGPFEKAFGFLVAPAAGRDHVRAEMRGLSRAQALHP